MSSFLFGKTWSLCDLVTGVLSNFGASEKKQYKGSCAKKLRFKTVSIDETLPDFVNTASTFQVRIDSHLGSYFHDLDMGSGIEPSDL